jgi:hypothetical protein
MTSHTHDVYEVEELEEDEEEDENEGVELSWQDIRAACLDIVEFPRSDAAVVVPDEEQKATLEEFYSRLRRCTMDENGTISATHFTQSMVAVRDGILDECNNYMRMTIGMPESELLRKAVSYFYDWGMTCDVVQRVNSMLLSMDMYQVCFLCIFFLLVVERLDI